MLVGAVELLKVRSVGRSFLRVWVPVLVLLAAIVLCYEVRWHRIDDSSFSHRCCAFAIDMLVKPN